MHCAKISEKSLIEVGIREFSITHSEIHETFQIPVSRQSLGMQKKPAVLYVAKIKSIAIQ